MTRFRATLAYDGTGFLGFQRQAAGPTIQGAVEAALRQLGWPGPTLWGAGRTDSGVHAAGQVIAFDLDWPHGAAALLRALNAHLPEAVAVQAVRACAGDFHPRYAARARRYRYSVYNQPVRSPLAARFAWHVWPALDGAALEAGSRLLLGRHDFGAFGTDPDAGSNTVRTVSLAEWSDGPGGWLYFDIQAEAFLYRMVRSLVGALKRVGTGDLSLDALAGILASRDRAQCPPLAPPHGLCLMEVVY